MDAQHEIIMKLGKMIDNAWYVLACLQRFKIIKRILANRNGKIKPPGQKQAKNIHLLYTFRLNQTQTHMLGRPGDSKWESNFLTI